MLKAALNIDSVISRISHPPLVTIIIPVYNGLNYTEKCLDSIYNSAVSSSFEVIVVNNGSSDGTADRLKILSSKLPSLRHVENSTNLGFGRAINQGAGIARGRYLVVANNDIIATPHWLDGLIAAAESRAEIGVVSPVTNYVGEGPQLDLEASKVEAATAISYAGELRKNRRTTFEVSDRLVFFCVLIKRELYEMIGGLSGVFGLGNFEDDDFCLRARLAGYKLIIEPNVFVFHFGSRTFVEQGIPYDDLMEKNRRIFFDRVAHLSTHLAPRPYRDKHKPIVSVVLRTSDRLPLLKDALSSLANQTFRPFETIIVNDGGKDPSPILDQFVESLNIEYVNHSERRGRPAALNSGVKAANGEWITYLDDDDIVYPIHLEMLADALRHSAQRQVAYSDVNRALYFCDEHGQVILSRAPAPSLEFNADRLLVENHIPILSLMHPKRCFEEVGLFDETLNELEDWEFLIRLSKSTPFCHLPTVTCEYRFRISKGYQNTLSLRRLQTLEAMRRIYDNHPLKDGAGMSKRKRALEGLEQEIRDLRDIDGLDYGEIEKAFLSTLRVFEFFGRDLVQVPPLT